MQRGLPVPPNPFNQIVTIPELKRYFEMATPEEADTIAILGRYYGDNGVVHMAIRDQDGLFVHVPRLGSRP